MSRMDTFTCSSAPQSPFSFPFLVTPFGGRKKPGFQYSWYIFFFDPFPSGNQSPSFLPHRLPPGRPPQPYHTPTARAGPPPAPWSCVRMPTWALMPRVAPTPTQTLTLFCSGSNVPRGQISMWCLPPSHPDPRKCLRLPGPTYWSRARLSRKGSRRAKVCPSILSPIPQCSPSVSLPVWRTNTAHSSA